MAQPLDDAALDTLFRTARTYNGYTDAPVDRGGHPQHLRSAQMGADLGQPGGTLRVVREPGESKEKLAGCQQHQCRQDPQGARRRDHRHGPGVQRAAALALPARADRQGLVPVRQTDPLHPRLPQLVAAGRLFHRSRARSGFDTGPMSGFDNAKVDAAFFAAPAQCEVQLHLDARAWRPLHHLRSPAAPEFAERIRSCTRGAPACNASDLTTLVIETATAACSVAVLDGAAQSRRRPRSRRARPCRAARADDRRRCWRRPGVARADRVLSIAAQAVSPAFAWASPQRSRAGDAWGVPVHWDIARSR
jgi:3-hydroxypropanoate dehydrogenase